MARPFRVLLASPHPADRDFLTEQLGRAGYEVHAFDAATPALEALSARAYAVVLVDADLGSDAGGIDVLYEARELDPEASLALVLGERHDTRLVAEAVNRCGVTKLIVRPWDADELVEDIFEAADAYRNGTHRNRSFALTKVRSRRLDRDRRRLRTDLARARRLIDDLAHQVEVLRAASVEQITAIPADAEAVASALFETLRAGSPEIADRSRRVADWAVTCAKALGWAAPEIEDLRLAALLHHILLPMSPEEDAAITPTATPSHASTAGRILAKIPSLETVADILARHHEPIPRKEHGSPPPRAAQLLQILSAYDTLLAQNRENNDDFRHARAFAHLAPHVDTHFPADLFTAALCEHLPGLVERSERAVPLGDLEPHMVVSRPVLSGHLSLVASRTALSERQIERLRAVDGPHRRFGIWIQAAEEPSDAARTIRRDSRAP